MLTMLPNKILIDVVETVEYGEGLRLWRLLVTDLEPQIVSRKMVVVHGFLNVSFGAAEVPRKGIDRVETQFRQHQSTTWKKIDDHMRTGVLSRELANGRELHKKLGDRLVANAYRVETFSEMRRNSLVGLDTDSLIAGSFPRPRTFRHAHLIQAHMDQSK